MISRNRLRSIAFSIGYWVLVANYFVLMRFTGIARVDGAHFSLELLLYATIVGVFIGSLFGIATVKSFMKLKKRRSFLFIILLNTAFYILFFTGVIFAASRYGNSLDFAIHYVFSETGFVTIFHLSVASLFYHLILQMSKKFGPGILIGYISGKYFHPKEEERVFMFIDLKSSTAIAEELEHIEYSKLIQDCYSQLTNPIMTYSAQVYQYVGDEVVLTWEIKEDFSFVDCLDFYYAFEERLEQKKEYYLNTYGVYPEFKVGMHCGTVTVAEVGELKTEIAYHGDVLNSAARIQGLCKEYKESFLVSESIIKHTTVQPTYRQAFIGNLNLRGKENKIKIYSINPV